MLRQIIDRPADGARGLPLHAADPAAFHRRLSYFNRHRLAVAVPHADWQEMVLFRADQVFRQALAGLAA